MIATLVSLGSNAAVIGAIYLYVRLLERNPTLELLGIALVPRESMLLLGGFVAAVLTGLLVLAASNYVARTASLRIRRLYLQEGRRQALQLIRHLPDPRAAELSVQLEGGGLRRTYTEYPRSCAWAMRVIGNATPALALFVGTYGALLFLDWRTTVFVTLMGLALVAAQYPAHLAAATASNTLDETRAAYVAKLSTLADAVDQAGDGPSDAAVAERIDRFSQDPQVSRFDEAGENRYRAVETGALWMESGGAIVLSAILFVIASGLVARAGDWAVLVAYATLLRQLLASVTRVFRAVTAFSRFSPHVGAYRRFVSVASRAVEEQGEAEPPLERVLLAARSASNGADVIELGPGERFVLVTKGVLGRGLAMAVQRAAVLAGVASPGKDASHALPEAASQRPRIRFVGSDSPAGADVPGSLRTRLEAALESARSRGADVLLVPRALFVSLGREATDHWAATLGDCRIGLVCASPPTDLAAHTLVLARDRADNLYWYRTPTDGISTEMALAIERSLQANQRGAGRVSIEDEEYE